MKLAKSLFLGSVAGLAAVAGAQAADLPAKKVAAVEYVRVCSTYGAGFFYIPGTDTCLRVSGRVRAQYIYGETAGFTDPTTGAFVRGRGQDSTGFYTRGRVQLDARTDTAYGLLRSVVRLELTRSSGTPFGQVNGGIATGAQVAEAFIQFGGLTAGRVTSFFSNSDLPTGHFGTVRFDDAPDVNLLAYTFSFGNGFSASISLEDALDGRREGIAGATYGGQRMPDVVGNVKYAGTWGSLQLSGAVHQIRDNTLAFVGDDFDTEYGFAVALAGSVNLPSLAAGDALWFAATFADGAPAYLNGGNSGTVISPFAAFAGVSADLVDATLTTDGDLQKTRAWSLAGGLRHYWAPTLRSNLFASYLNSDSRLAVNTAADFREWRVGGNIIWTPVSGLDLGVEVIYANVDRQGLNPVTGVNYRNENGFEGRLRIQRDF